jgi:hypothetical protein
VDGAAALALQAEPGADPGTVTGTSFDVKPAESTTYTLTATNARGSVKADVSVTVTSSTTTLLGFAAMTELADRSGAGTGTSVAGTALFTRLAAPSTLPNDGNPYEAYRDTCLVHRDDETDPSPDPTDPGNLTSLSAGPSVNVLSPTGTYARLLPVPGLTYVLYGTDPQTPPSSPMPDALTANMSGANGGFPAYTGRAFPDVAPFALTLPADPGTILRTTTFTWTGASADALIVLHGSGAGAGGHVVSFTCVAADDGSFAFPPATRTALAAGGFTSGALERALRSGFASYRQGSALLVLATQRGETY